MGDGAFSVVYKAYDIKTETEVAVKVVRKHELSNTQVSFFFFFFIYSCSLSRSYLTLF